MGVHTTIPIWLLPAASQLWDAPAGIWLTADCSIHNRQNGRINAWCNYRKYRIIIPRPVPWGWLSIVFTHPLPRNVGIHIHNGKAKWLHREIGRGIATCIDLWSVWPKVLSSSRSISVHHSESQMRPLGDEIHINVHEFPDVSRGCVDPIFPLPKAHLRYLAQCCLVLLAGDERLVCDVRFLKWPFGCAITDGSNATIHWEIPLHGASTSLLADAHGLGNLSDALPQVIMFLLCCPATLRLWIPHGFGCTVADSNNGVHGPDVNL